MTLKPDALRFVGFRDAEDLLTLYYETPQGQYLTWYLADLGAKTVIVEPQYFDRDYLSEFAAFYCLSSAGYPNCCKRLHYFAADVGRALFERAAGGEEAARKALQDAYIGFVVLRPIEGTPIGRTVLSWYPDPKKHHLPRVVEPSRWYTCHVAGVELKVQGLAWQQQDVGVGACATVALWSMLHSSAFDDRHVVPTTAEVTQTAHRAGLSAQPPFPSKGLSFGQLVAAVRDSGFAPLVIGGELGQSRFSREHLLVARIFHPIWVPSPRGWRIRGQQRLARGVRRRFPASSLDRRRGLGRARGHQDRVRLPP